ncbi:MAG: translocation/assembly module TamB domain-containing protein [Fidelibacterota bacterium]
MKQNKTHHSHHYPPKTVIPFILVFLLGLFVVVLFNPRLWFKPLSGYMTRKLEQHLNAEFLIGSVEGNFNRVVYADSLQILNHEQAFDFYADRVSVSYKNIVFLAMTRTIDTLILVNPVMKSGPGFTQQPEKNVVATLVKVLNKFPTLKINTLSIQHGQMILSQPEGKTLQIQDISGAFAVNTRGPSTRLSARSLSCMIPEEKLTVDSLKFSVTALEGLVKVQNFTAWFDGMQMNLTGKFQPVQTLPFKGEILLQKFRPARWIPRFKAYPEDVVDILVDFSGNRDYLQGNFSLQGLLAHDILRQCEGNIRLLHDRLELSHVAFENSYLDAVIRNLSFDHGSLSLDGHIDQIGFPKESPLNEMAIAGDVTASGRFPDSLMIDYELSGKYKQEFLIDAIEGQVLFQNQNLVFADTTKIRLPGLALDLRGHIDSMSTLDLRFDMMADDFRYDLNTTDRLKLGDARIQGRLQGKLSNPDISAIYLINEASMNDYRVSRARGAASVAKMMDHPSGNLYMDLSGLEIPPYSINNGGTFLEFKSDTVLISSFSLSTDKNRIEFVGKLTMDSLLLIQEFAANLQGNDLFLQSPFHIDLRQNQVDVSPVLIQFNDGFLRGEGSWDTSRRFRVNIQGESLDLSELLTVGSYPVDAGGMTDFQVQLSGMSENPILQFEGRVKDFTYGQYHFEDLSAHFTYQDSLLLLEKAGIAQNPRDYINLFGQFPMYVGYENDLLLTFPKNDPFSLTFEVNQFSTGIFSSLHKAIQEMEGLANGVITASGSYRAPEIQLNVTLEDFRLNGFAFDRILSNLSYKNQKISIENVDLISETGSYSMSGFYPVDLSLYPVSRRINPQDSVSIRLEGRDGTLSYLEPLIRIVEGSQGTFITELELSGSPLKPAVNGRLVLEKSMLTLKNLLNPVRNVQGSFLVKDNFIDVDLKGNMEKEDTRLFNLGRDVAKNRNVAMTGRINIQDILNPVMDLRLTGKNIYVRSLNDRIDLIGDGDITLRGRDTLRAEGIYAAREGVLNFDFKRPVQNRSRQPRKRVFEYILEIPMDGNVFLRNELIDAELEGDIVLEKRADEPQILAGNLSVRSGKFYYYSAIFDIESGEITFDPYANNITLNFQAVTPVLDGSNRVIATLTGDVDKPTIQLTDEKNMFTSQAEIIQLLTTGTVSNGQFVTGAAQSYLETIFEKELERTASEWGGFERVDLKSQGSLFENPNLDSLTILLERRIGKDLYLSYEQSLSNDNANRNIELEYRLNRNFSIIGEADDESVSFSYRIRFQY